MFQRNRSSRAANEPHQEISDAMDRKLVDESLILDYLFATPRLWPQFELHTEKRLREEPEFRKMAVGEIGRMYFVVGMKVSFRPDLPEDIRTALNRLVEGSEPGANTGSASSSAT